MLQSVVLSYEAVARAVFVVHSGRPWRLVIRRHRCAILWARPCIYKNTTATNLTMQQSEVIKGCVLHKAVHASCMLLMIAQAGLMIMHAALLVEPA